MPPSCVANHRLPGRWLCVGNLGALRGPRQLIVCYACWSCVHQNHSGFRRARKLGSVDARDQRIAATAVLQAHTRAHQLNARATSSYNDPNRRVQRRSTDYFGLFAIISLKMRSATNWLISCPVLVDEDAGSAAGGADCFALHGAISSCTHLWQMSSFAMKLSSVADMCRLHFLHIHV